MKKSVLRSFIITATLIFALSLNQSCKKDCPEPECDTCLIAYKPNIYFFPEQDIHIDVKLDFPLGGEVIKSEPYYNNGWSVTIDKTGLIEGTYDFLFYESIQPDVWQYEKGWLVEREMLKTFFEENLNEYGFREKEIDDFIEYWIPKFNKSAYYLIYPQEKEIIESVISLSLSTEPDNILRLHYVIKETDDENVNVVAPVIPEFKREGFFVTEWGVIL